MKSRILILGLLLACLSLLMSCVTQRACNRRYPSANDTIHIVTVKDSIVIKDTTIYIHLPGEVVIDSVEIPCPDPGPAYIPKKVFAETSLARAEAWFQFPNIKLLLVQKDTTIEKRLEGALKEAYYWKSEYSKITVKPEPVKFIPGIYRASFWAWIGVILAGFGYVAIRVFVLRR